MVKCKDCIYGSKIMCFAPEEFRKKNGCLLIDEGQNRMVTNKEKQKFVEQMLKEFAINMKFRDALSWLIGEMDIVYSDLLEQQKG